MKRQGKKNIKITLKKIDLISAETQLNVEKGMKKYIVCMKHHLKIWYAVLMLKVMTRGINGSEAESSKG